MSSPLLQPVFDYYSTCGSLCALYELEIRLITGRTPELEHLAYERLSNIRRRIESGIRVSLLNWHGVFGGDDPK